MNYFVSYALISLSTALFIAALFLNTYLSPNGLLSSVNTVTLLEEHGFSADIHNVETSDGYIVTVHRMSRKTSNDKNLKRYPILLMHGMGGSSADWVVAGPKTGLGYILYDGGYDVWIANARGTSWSRNHTFLNSEKDKKYWDFSWHEIGYFDLPSMVHYILDKTLEKNLIYIGHSQGSTAFFVTTSTIPEMNKKIRLSINFAPGATYRNYFPKAVHSFLKVFIPVTQKITNFLGIYELPFRKIFTPINKLLCIGKFGTQYMCKKLLQVMSVNLDEKQLNTTLLPILLSFVPDAASSKQLYHYVQLRLSDKFQWYDYGPKKNLQKYRSINPPEYNLTRISTPVALYYGMNDMQVTVRDVESLYSRISKIVVKKYLVPYEEFNHVDFVIAKDAVKLLYDDVINLIKKYVN